jgi:hypothetical protein
VKNTHDRSKWKQRKNGERNIHIKECLKPHKNIGIVLKGLSGWKFSSKIDCKGSLGVKILRLKLPT